MQTLSYGYKLPEAGDRGSIWFPALEDNITRLNSHDHDGTDSSLLSASVITKGSVSVLAAAWTLVSTGKYKQTVTCPSGFNMTDHIPHVYLTVLGHVIHPTIEKVTNTTFDIYTLDNTLAYTVIFR
jgi:hypothetical protein